MTILIAIVIELFFLFWFHRRRPMRGGKLRRGGSNSLAARSSSETFSVDRRRRRLTRSPPPAPSSFWSSITTPADGNWTCARRDVGVGVALRSTPTAAEGKQKRGNVPRRPIRARSKPGESPLANERPEMSTSHTSHHMLIISKHNGNWLASMKKKSFLRRPIRRPVLVFGFFFWVFFWGFSRTDVTRVDWESPPLSFGVWLVTSKR